MARAMYMTTLQAATEIASALINLGDEEAFEHREFPYPGWSSVQYNPGKPSIISRFESIAEDAATENEDIVVPSGLRFEVRILHTSDYGPSGVSDPYAYAQERILEGTDTFFTALAEDRTLGDLVIDCGVEASLIGDLVDPTTNENFYGHEMTMVTKLFYTRR